MILTGALLVGVLAAWLLIAGIESYRLGIAFRQAFLYAPLKLVWSIDDAGLKQARDADPPVIYVVTHQSRIDPALMLALLPEQTLHILDEYSARAMWLEPFRELARTIAFNAEHVFVSRRLVRHLRGKGRLAVYFPEAVEPDAKAYRLYRAVARIAVKAEAKIVPVFVNGARYLPFSLTGADKAPRRFFTRLRIITLPAMTIAQLNAQAGAQTSVSNALFDRSAEARLLSNHLDRGLFHSLRDAADRFGASTTIIEDALGGTLTYRRLLIGTRILGHRLASVSAPGEAVGLLLPNANAAVVSLAGLASAGRVAAMINYTAGAASVTAAVRTALIRTVVSSRAFVAKADLGEVVAAAERGGAKILWLEDLQAGVGTFEKLVASVLWRRPIVGQDGSEPGVILFTSGSEGAPKAVVLSQSNLVANAMQAEARLDLSPRDKLLNVLPMFHSFGLTAGTILPLLIGVRLFLYPSPLHYRLIPEIAAKTRPTILVGTDTFLNGYARAAKDSDFASLRLVVAGAEAVKAETRRVWRERFGAEIVEGFGLTEAAPVVAVNSATHNREGTVGRMLPGMRHRLEPVEGVTEGGRLWVSGPNIMIGYMTADRPGEVQSVPEGWHDTGDIVTVDREGYVAIRGRAKRFAKIGGEMVSLGAVEMLVQALWPEDRHAVVSAPDRRKGERIVLVTTADEAEAAALRRFGRQSGAAEIMVPDDIVKVAEIPVLGSGKTDYVAARNLALEKLGVNAKTG